MRGALIFLLTITIAGCVAAGSARLQTNSRSLAEENHIEEQADSVAGNAEVQPTATMSEVELPLEAGTQSLDSSIGSPSTAFQADGHVPTVDVDESTRSSEELEDSTISSRQATREEDSEVSNTIEQSSVAESAQESPSVTSPDNAERGAPGTDSRDPVYQQGDLGSSSEFDTDTEDSASQELSQEGQSALEDVFVPPIHAGLSNEKSLFLFLAAVFFGFLAIRRGIGAAILFAGLKKDDEGKVINWGVPWDKSASVSCSLFGVVNALVLFYIAATIMEALATVGRIMDDSILLPQSAQTIIAALGLSAILAGFAGFVLSLRAYRMVKSEKMDKLFKERRYRTRAGYVNEALRNRNVTNIEVVGVPFAIGFVGATQFLVF